MVLHQLDYDPDVVTVVLDGDNPHDVGGILRIWIWTVFVGQNKAGICFMDLVYFRSIKYNSIKYMDIIFGISFK